MHISTVCSWLHVSNIRSNVQIQCFRILLCDCFCYFTLYRPVSLKKCVTAIAVTVLIAACFAYAFILQRNMLKIFRIKDIQGASWPEIQTQKAVDKKVRLICNLERVFCVHCKSTVSTYWLCHNIARRKTNFPTVSTLRGLSILLHKSVAYERIAG